MKLRFIRFRNRFTQIINNDGNEKLLALIPLASLHLAVAQVRDYDPSVQPVDRIQYFKPAESHLLSAIACLSIIAVHFIFIGLSMKAIMPDLAVWADISGR